MKKYTNILKCEDGYIYMITADGTAERTDARRLEPIANGLDDNDIAPLAITQARDILANVKRTSEPVEQITHIVETTNARLTAITEKGATRWIGWEGLQDIADGNNPDATDSARADAAEILKRKKEADDLRDTCKHKALELEAVAAYMMLICPECGGKHHRDDYTESKNEDDKPVYTCPSCGATVDDLDDLDALTLSEYLADNFGTEYRIDDTGDLRHVQIMIACGGPNIYIDTERRAVCLYWWDASADFPISCADDVEELAREWYEGLRA